MCAVYRLMHMRRGKAVWTWYEQLDHKGSHCHCYSLGVACACIWTGAPVRMHPVA